MAEVEYVGRNGGGGRLELAGHKKDFEFEHRYLGTFQQLDPNKDGKVLIRTVRQRLQERGLGLPEHIRDELLRRADLDKDGFLDFNEFLYLIEIVDSHAHLGTFHRSLALASYTVLPESERPEFVDGELRHYNCCPPPIFVILVSCLQLGVSLYFHFTMKGGMGMNSGVTKNNIFIYNPFRRREAWRLLSYMLVHVGWWHLIVNLLVQLILGVPLELVHKFWRVGIIYLLGVIAGSLGTSVTDPNVFIAGASGGVYALIAAHLASIVINWKEMEYNWIRLVFWLILAGSDVGVAIYQTYFTDNPVKVGYMAHFSGAVIGFLLGVVCLRNLKSLQWERVFWWICLAATGLLFAFAIVWNIFWPGFPKQVV